MSKKLFLAAAAAGVMIWATPGFAQSPALQQETPEDRQACTDDAFQHCGDLVPDRDRVYQCLLKKVKTISPACRKVITRPAPKH
jgi:short subunit fatty acids transporter